MSFVVFQRIGAPTSGMLFSTDLFKAQAYVTHDEDDDLIEGYSRSCMQHFENVVGYSLTETEWRFHVPDFKTLEDGICFGPMSEPALFYYPSNGGAAVEIESDDFESIRMGYHRNRLSVNLLGDAPQLSTTRARPIYLNVMAGFVTIPNQIVQAGLLMASHWYENRTAVVITNSSEPFEMPLSVTALITPFIRVYH